MKRTLSVLFLIILMIPVPIILQAAGEKPTVFIIGDSTVKNGRGDGAGGLRGWGEKIHLFLDTTRLTIRNHALGGTSSRTFITRGLWDQVLEQLKPGDFVLMQFGHNDGGAINDTLRARGTIRGTGEETVEIDNLLTQKHERVHSYGWYLRRMIREAKAKGAIPVVVTPIPRNDWEDGKVKRTPVSYPQWAMEVARDEKVKCIDLNRLMSEKMDTFGEQQVTGRFFLSSDHTHTTEEGAVMSASLLIRGMKKSKKCQLVKWMVPTRKLPY